MNQTRRGHYLGTEIDSKWYKRYYGKGYFMRGAGEYRIADGVLYFRRYLTKTPLEIPLSDVTEIRVGSWHAGKWMIKTCVLKFIWGKDGVNLSSGFVFAKNHRLTMEFKTQFEKLIATLKDPSGG